MKKVLVRLKESKVSTVVLVFVIGRLITAVGLSMDLKLWPSRSCPACYSLKTLGLDGNISFHNNERAGRDFGDRYRHLPAAVLYPASVRDIAAVVKTVYISSKLTVAARGHGHSLHGQAQALNGVVIEMQSLRGIEVHREYVDASAGELWINVLQATLRKGLAPKSWTDYLYLSVGGTLSNGGISGQAFRHGPQITNVHRLQIVTGKGEVLNCSREQNADLFYAALGGLGQFGVITAARIALQPAPQMVKWIRVLYSDFAAFTRDQEFLISEQNGRGSFDYIEGFVNVNNEGLLNNWRSSFFSPQNPVKVNSLNTKGRILYCLEMTKNYNHHDALRIDEEVKALLDPLSFIPSSVFTTDIPYVDFLDRVHTAELKLRSKGLWETPHPWLNLFIPKKKIAEFDAVVFRNILGNTSTGPILVYPMNRSKWDEKMLAITPDEDIFYLVALLRSAIPSSNGSDSLKHLSDQNDEILDFCNKAGIGHKQYLPHYTTEGDWMKHYGRIKWKEVVKRKSIYDPNAILAPGQRMFSSTGPLSASPNCRDPNFKFRN